MTNQEIASKIVKILDDYMLENSKSFLTLSAANSLVRESAFYRKNKLDKNVLKKLLDSGLIPNASQTKHKPRQWRILPSSALKPKKEIATTNSTNQEINKQTASTQKFFVTIKCPWAPHKIRALVPNSGKTLIRCATCNKVFEYPDPSLVIMEIDNLHNHVENSEAHASESLENIEKLSKQSEDSFQSISQAFNDHKNLSFKFTITLVLLGLLVIAFFIVKPIIDQQSVKSSKNYSQLNNTSKGSEPIAQNKTDYDTLTGIEYIEKYRNSNTAKTQVKEKKLFVQAEAYNDRILSCNIGVVSASNSNEFLKLPKSGALEYVFYTADGKRLNLDPYTEIQASSDLIYIDIYLNENIYRVSHVSFAFEYSPTETISSRKIKINKARY